MDISGQLQQLIQGSRASKVGLAARRLDGQSILIHADQPFHPASVFKICVMIETFHQARLGTIRMDDPVQIKNEFLSIADGSPYALDAKDDSEQELYGCIGRSFPRIELVRRMVTVSSNLATNILMADLKPGEITGFMQELGGEDLTVVRGVEDKKAYRLGLNNSVKPRGLMTILLKLAKGEVCSADDSQEMIGILSAQQFNEMIPAQLPAGTRVAHKTGWTADYFHDAGIVYPASGEPFVLVILTKGYPENEEQAAHAFIASLARAVYESWNPRSA